MPAQLNYQKGQSEGLPGQLANIGDTDIDSFQIHPTNNPVLEYGIFVGRNAQGTIDITALVIGVTVRGTNENTLGGDNFISGEYTVENNDVVPVLRRGQIYAQFDAPGGTLGQAVTITANGYVASAGGAVALVGPASATIESKAVDVSQDGTGIYVGRVRVTS